MEEGHTLVPDNIPPDVTRVNLYKNQISSLIAGDFSELSVCETLDLSINMMSVIEPGAFRGKIKQTGGEKDRQTDKQTDKQTNRRMKPL